jgi:hypothetical protein
MEVNLTIDIGEVFPEAAPTYTLVKRGHRVKDIQDALRIGGRIIRLHGASKIGKTLLCREVLRDRNPITVYGDDIQTKEQFWQLVAAKVGVPPAAVIDCCIRGRRPIIIENFHWVNGNVRIALVRSFRELTEGGGTVVLISIPDVAKEFLDQMRGGTKEDAILGELLAKSVTVAAPIWDNKEIEQIPHKGFREALNVDLPEWTVTVLTRFAFKNPLLMHKHCAQLCHVLNVRSSLAKRALVTPTVGQLVAVFQKVAWDNGGELFNGLITRDANRIYRLKSGKKVNLTELALFAIASLGIAMRLGMPNLQRRIKEALATGGQSPSPGEIKVAINRLIDNMRRIGQSGLVVDEAGFLYLAHPFFKAYLVWKHVPALGGELPDLDRYIEPDEPAENAA